MTGRLGKPYISGTGALHNGRQSVTDTRKRRPGGTHYTPRYADPKTFWIEWAKRLAGGR